MDCAGALRIFSPDGSNCTFEPENRPLYLDHTLAVQTLTNAGLAPGENTGSGTLSVRFGHTLQACLLILPKLHELYICMKYISE